MEKNELMSMTVAAIVCLVMVGLTRIPAYVEAMNNWLLIVLLLFSVTAIFGMGIHGLFFGLNKKRDRK